MHQFALCCGFVTYSNIVTKSCHDIDLHCWAVDDRLLRRFASILLFVGCQQAAKKPFICEVSLI